jgi:alpha 1,2-mannosyltransferase
MELRTRTASQSPLLPSHQAAPLVVASATVSSRRRWRCRLWLPRLLLLVGALYVTLLCCWSRLEPSRVKSALEPAVAVTGDPTPPPEARTPPPMEQLSAREVSIRAALAVARQQETEMKAKKTPTDKKEKKKEVDARLRCRGWKATSDCNPDGERLPEHDLPCGKPVPADRAGYCELEDKDTGDVFHVVKRTCDSVRDDAKFRCLDAGEFVKFPIRANEVAKKAMASGFSLPHVVPLVAGVDTNQSDGQNGIVIVVYPRMLASAYATVRTLRDVLDCQLPIELWFRPDEMKSVRQGFAPFKRLVETDATRGITFHEINDARAFGYGTKIYAIYHSFFERVLFLDADNVPVRDPSFLFDSPEFVETGAIFWPDFWHPGHTIFNIHERSLVWQFLGVPFKDSFEQESGQLLIDRRRHAVPMEVLSFYAFHRPNLFDNFKLAHGDKDLFRFAWMHQNASFLMIKAPPAVAGKVIDGNFCGMTMVQHDAQGEVLFLHRNSHKLTGSAERGETVNVRAEALAKAKEKLAVEKEKKGQGRLTPKWSEVEAEIAAISPAATLQAPESDGLPDEIIWTHLLSFNSTAPRVDYAIETYSADPQFPREQHCYGQRYIGSNPNFYAQEIADLPFAGLETNLRQFAAEAVRQTADDART